MATVTVIILAVPVPSPAPKTKKPSRLSLAVHGVLALLAARAVFSTVASHLGFASALATNWLGVPTWLQLALATGVAIGLAAKKVLAGVRDMRDAGGQRRARARRRPRR